MYIDCHAHIFFSPIPADAIDDDITGEIPTPTFEFIENMIFNAKEKGVSHIVGVISNPNDFPNYQKQLELEDIVHVIGISRNYASKNHADMMLLLQQEIETKTPHGIGEIGLDYSYSFNNLNESKKNTIKKKQQELFRKQIQIAKDIDVPIVIHAGYGDDKDILEIIKQEKAQDIGGQIHGYMSKKEVVSELIDLGFYFSFGYSHTIKEEFRRIIEITPVEQLLAETDSPYHLMESPKKFILPENVVLVTSEIAALKEVKVEDLANQVMRNARVLFKF